MALIDLIRDDSTDGPTAGVSVVGPCTLLVDGTSVFDGATSEVQISTADVAGQYKSAGTSFSISTPRANQNIEALGTYFLRVNNKNVGANTNITIEINQP